MVEERGDPDALISVEVSIVSPNAPSLLRGREKEDEDRERLQFVTIQFNSLDVIANQARTKRFCEQTGRIQHAVLSPKN